MIKKFYQKVSLFTVAIFLTTILSPVSFAGSYRQSNYNYSDTKDYSISARDYHFSPSSPNINEETKFDLVVKNTGKKSFDDNLELSLVNSDDNKVIIVHKERIRIEKQKTKKIFIKHKFKDGGSKRVYLQIRTKSKYKYTFSSKTPVFVVVINKKKDDKPSTQTVVLNLKLNAEKNVPPINSSGTGSGTLRLNLGTRELSGSINFSNLTSDSTAAHIHRGGPNENGPILIPLEGGIRSRSGTYKVPSNTILTRDELDLLKDDKLYINIHSKKYPDGEIRGQICYSNLEDSKVKYDKGYKSVYDKSAKDFNFKISKTKVREKDRVKVNVKNVSKKSYYDDFDVRLIDSNTGKVFLSQRERLNLKPNQTVVIFVNYEFNYYDQKHVYIQVSPKYADKNSYKNYSDSNYDYNKMPIYYSGEIYP